MAKVIPVTQPFLPPLDELHAYLEKIWQDKCLTNNGPFLQQLEGELAEYLGVPHVSLLANGTIALVVAMQALGIKGEVITTPFSFVATAHSLLWNGIKPVFVDIDPVTLNLDPNKVEAAITPQTTAILPVHVYGRPADVDRLQGIADAHGLKLVYDAAHAFAVRHRGASLLGHGDMSVLSFHATKVFNTFEGGAIVCRDEETKRRIYFLKNFGIADEVTVVAPGINGKMNEFQAALGLLQLKYIDRCIAKRREIDKVYREELVGIPGIQFLSILPETESNYAYFPILVGPDYALTRDGLYQKLRERDIHARRYFYPLISDFPMYRGLSSAVPENLPIAKRIADQVLCLPIYPDLTRDDQERVISALRGG